MCRGVDVWAGNNPLILDVNWSIMPGERWAIQGTNGCGKSTLLYAGYVENEASMAWVPVRPRQLIGRGRPKLRAAWGMV